MSSSKDRNVDTPMGTPASSRKKPMSSEVNCNVDNCVYWQDMKCSANSIHVKMQGNQEEVCSSEATICETFETKECQYNTRKSIRAMLGICSIALSILHVLYEEIEQESWFFEFLEEIPSEYFMRKGKTSVS